MQSPSSAASSPRSILSTTSLSSSTLPRLSIFSSYQSNAQEIFNARPLPSPMKSPPIAPSEAQPLAPNEGFPAVRDPMAEVGIRARALVRLGMISGAWAILSLDDGGLLTIETRHNGHDGRPVDKVCRLIAIDRDPVLRFIEPKDDYILLVPPPMLFNLASSLEPCRMRISRYTDARGGGGGMGVVERNGGILVSHRPPLAAEATIARVKAPNSSGREDYAAAIAHFFSVPRVLSQGDLIAVPVPRRGPSEDALGGAVGSMSSGGGGGGGGGMEGGHHPPQPNPIDPRGRLDLALDLVGMMMKSRQRSQHLIVHKSKPAVVVEGGVEESKYGIRRDKEIDVIVSSPPCNGMNENGKPCDDAKKSSYPGVMSRTSELVFFEVTKLVVEGGEEDEGEEGEGQEGLNGQSKGGGDGQHHHHQQPLAMIVSRFHTTLMQAGASVQAAIPDPDACHPFQCLCLDLAPPPAAAPLSSSASSSPNNHLPPPRLRFLPPPPRLPLDPTSLTSLTRLLQPLVKGMGPSAPLLMRSAILVYGPAGMGKRSLIRGAAHAVGCHLREVRTRTLLRPTDVATITAFRAMLDEVLEVAPCILHLVNVKAAFNPSVRRHGGPEVPELETRMAAALRICLEELGSRMMSKMMKGRGREAKARRLPVIIVGSCDSIDDLAEPIRRCFSHELKLVHPEEGRRIEVLKHSVAKLGSQIKLASDLDLQALARRTAGRTPAELERLVEQAAQGALSRVNLSRLLANSSASLVSQKESAAGQEEKEGGKSDLLSNVIIEEKDVKAAEKALTAVTPSSAPTPKIPDVRWEDIGGLAHVRREILDVIELPLKHPEVFTAGVKRRAGILLYGPPGTGKTLLAKAVATECGLAFLSVKGPELLDMYIGESERNVRAVFAQARAAAPSVLFFDELDSLAPQRGRGSDSGGVMDRVVAQLLVELDGVSSSGGGKGNDVFVIGATNRPDLLDSSLLRPGRFDRLLYLSNAQDPASRFSVLQASTRKFLLAEGVDIQAIVDGLPSTFTGADFSAVASQALLRALKRRMAELEEELAVLNSGSSAATGEEGGGGGVLSMTTFLSQLEPHELVARVRQEDFLEAATVVTPSVSIEELRHYERLREQFSSQAHGGSGPSSSSSSLSSSSLPDNGGGRKEFRADMLQKAIVKDQTKEEREDQKRKQIADSPSIASESSFKATTSNKSNGGSQHPPPPLPHLHYPHRDLSTHHQSDAVHPTTSSDVAVLDRYDGSHPPLPLPHLHPPHPDISTHHQSPAI